MNNFDFFLDFMNTFSEAAVRRCSSKYVLLNIPAEVFLFANFLTSFYRTPTVAASVFFESN